MERWVGRAMGVQLLTPKRLNLPIQSTLSVQYTDCMHLVNLMITSPLPIVVIDFQFSEYFVREGGAVSVCLSVTGGVIAPGVAVSVLLVASEVQGNWYTFQRHQLQCCCWSTQFRNNNKLEGSKESIFHQIWSSKRRTKLSSSRKECKLCV